MEAIIQALYHTAVFEVLATVVGLLRQPSKPGSRPDRNTITARAQIIAMPQPGVPAHLPSRYTTLISSKAEFTVPEGELDPALPVLEACLAGDNTTLKNLLSQAEKITILLDVQYCIISEHRPIDKDVKNDTREVSADWMPNLTRAMNLSAVRGHAEVVSTLLNFAKQHDVELLNVIRYYAVLRVIYGNYTDVLEALIAAEPSVVTFHMGHGLQPLDLAIRSRKPDIVDVLFRHGATVKHPGHGGYGHMREGGYRVSLLSKAAAASSSRIIETLLNHGATIAGSGALHHAAECGLLDNICLLIERGADVNELLAPDSLHESCQSTYSTWTPMHFAAHGRHVDAMELLESKGAKTDAKDRKGRTPSQLLEEEMEEHRLAEAGKS